jgi:hypothetical protein
MKKRSKCIGFGEFEGKCDKKVAVYSNHWCKRCEKLRREHVSSQFEKLSKEFPDGTTEEDVF